MLLIHGSRMDDGINNQIDERTLREIYHRLLKKL